MWEAREEERFQEFWINNDLTTSPKHRQISFGLLTRIPTRSSRELVSPAVIETTLKTLQTFRSAFNIVIIPLSNYSSVLAISVLRLLLMLSSFAPSFDNEYHHRLSFSRVLPTFSKCIWASLQQSIESIQVSFSVWKFSNFSLPLPSSSSLFAVFAIFSSLSTFEWNKFPLFLLPHSTFQTRPALLPLHYCVYSSRFPRFKVKLSTFPKLRQHNSSYSTQHFVVMEKHLRSFWTLFRILFWKSNRNVLRR